MVQIPVWLFVVCATCFALAVFFWSMEKLHAWFEAMDARRIADEHARYQPLLSELNGYKDRCARLEAENHSLRDEVCTLITRTIHMSNALRSDETSKTQVLQPMSSARFPDRQQSG